MWSIALAFIGGLIIGYILGLYSILEVFIGTVLDWIIENLFRLFR